MAEDTLRVLAEQQHGVVATWQLDQRGRPSERVQGGQWELVTSTVLRRTGSPQTPEQRVMAAVLDAGHGALGSIVTAAAVWELPGFGLRELDVTRGGRRTSRTPPLARLHRPVLLLPHHRTVRNGIPVTTLARTIFDLAGSGVNPARIARLVNMTANKSPGTLVALHRTLDELAKKGRPGITVMREVLAARPVGSVLPASGLEMRFEHLLARPASVTPSVARSTSAVTSGVGASTTSTCRSACSSRWTRSCTTPVRWTSQSGSGTNRGGSSRLFGPRSPSSVLLGALAPAQRALLHRERGGDLRSTALDGHWFEDIAAHAGAAYLRYSFTKGTVQEVDFLVDVLGLKPGDRVLDVGCGPGRHVHELAGRGIEAHGVDISQRFVEVGVETAPELATFERLDAGTWLSTASSTPPSPSARARSDSSVARTTVTSWPVWRTPSGPAERWRSAPSPPTSRSATSRPPTASTPTPASTTSGPR